MSSLILDKKPKKKTREPPPRPTYKDGTEVRVGDTCRYDPSGYDDSKKLCMICKAFYRARVECIVGPRKVQTSAPLAMCHKGIREYVPQNVLMLVERG